jgi:hypothetical protein
MNNKVDSHIQRLVDAGVSGLDILHGVLKNLMLIAEKELENAQEVEDESGEAMDSMDRTRCEGVLDALTEVYALTYDISFAIEDKEKSNGNA